jgi:hypothetical protein
LTISFFFGLGCSILSSLNFLGFTISLFLFSRYSSCFSSSSLSFLSFLLSLLLSFPLCLSGSLLSFLLCLSGSLSSGSLSLKKFDSTVLNFGPMN